ncbi:FlaD/FlaE family flagellar protein [Halorussus sp. MSC15.2]|uniref:FlaD/FlaE family flagellar protein n=1 Tax=Halorussus sp. MSC15.2 TaxID=2283638 RepID=UPI0013D2C733|nr:FlaD/FlaE family flagellar protein [Halorussus sp. MSC15.2]NEU58887.1 fla cluster protein FlaD1 [Halorussus sp. MSC15.2]
MPTTTGDYDLRELRRLADPNRETPEEFEDDAELPASPEEVLRHSERDELVRLQSQFSAAGVLPERPYLEALPNQYSTEVVVFEWLDLLINKAGFENTGNALEYYEEVGWITTRVRENLREYMRGFSEVDSFDPDKPGPADLDVDDHVLSLVYIARLASV